MRFQQLIFRTIPHHLVEWFDGELEKRGIDSAYTHCVLSILQEDHHDTEPDECEVKNHQLKVIKKYGGPESLYSTAKPKHQKWKTYDKQILLCASTPCCDVSITDLERKKRNNAVSCLKSVSDDITIDDLIDELCLKLKNVKILNERKNSSKSHITDKETPFYIPPSSPTDQVEKYFAAFPPLEKQREVKGDLNLTVNSNAWSGSYVCRNKISGQNIIQKNVKHFEKRENLKNMTNSYGSLKSIENIYVPNSSVTENVAKIPNPSNKYGNNFQIEFCDENTCNFSAMRKSGTKLHNPLTCGMNLNKINELDSQKSSENICDVITTIKSAFEKPKPCQTLNNACTEYNSHKAELNSAQKIKILSSSTYQLITSRNRVNKSSDLRNISTTKLFMPIKEETSIIPIRHFPNATEKLEIDNSKEHANSINSTNKSLKWPFEEPVLQFRKEFEKKENICGRNNFIVLKIDFISNGRNKITPNKLESSSLSVPQKICMLESNQHISSGYESNFVLKKEDKVKIGKIIECNYEVVAYLKSVNGLKRIHAPRFGKIILNIPGKLFRTKFIDHNFDKSFLLMFERIPCDISKSIMKMIEAIQFVKQIKHKGRISCSQFFLATFILKNINGSYKIYKTSFTMKSKKSPNVSKDLSKTIAKRNKSEAGNKCCSASLNMSEKCDVVDFLVENENSNTCNKDICLVHFSPDKFMPDSTVIEAMPDSTVISSKYVTSQSPAKILEMKQPYDDSKKCVKISRNCESFNTKENVENSEMEYFNSSELFPCSLKLSDNLKHEENSPSVSILAYHNSSTLHLKHEHANYQIDNIKEENMFNDSKKYHNLETVVFAPSFCKCICTNAEKELLFQGECETSNINFCIHSGEIIEDNNSKPNVELPMSLKYLATLHLTFELNLVNVLKIANFNLELMHPLSETNFTGKDMFEIITTGDLTDVKYLIDLFSSLGYFDHNMPTSVGMNINDGEIILPIKKAFGPKYCMKQCINNSSSDAKSDCEIKYLYSSKVFLSSSEFLDRLKKKKVIASFSIPSYPLIAAPHHLKYEDINHTRSDIKVEMHFIHDTGLPLNNAPIYSQSSMNTELSIPWPIFPDLTEIENLDLDETHKLYFSCEPSAQKQSLNPQNPASQVFSWKYPNFTDSHIQKSDVRLNNPSNDVKSSSHLIHRDSFHNKNIYQHYNTSQPLIDNQNIQYFTNPFNMDVESKIGTIFPSKSEDIKSPDNFEAFLHDHEFEKPSLSSSNNTEAKTFASNPRLPLCLPSAFKPFKQCNNGMPKRKFFCSSGQKLLKKVINMDQIIQEVAAKDRVTFLETMSSFSEPDEIVSNPPLKLEQISGPSYSDAKNSELNSFSNFENPLWSVDSVSASSSWSNQYNLKSIWNDNSDSIDCIWKNGSKTLENDESCYALSDYSNSCALCNDSKNEDELLRGLFPLPDSKVEANVTCKNDNYIQSCESYNAISEQPIDISNLSTHDILASDQAVSNFSTSNNNMYSLSVPHNDPVGFFCLDNCKSDELQTETECLGADYSSNVEAQAYQALDFSDLSAFRGPYGSYNGYGSNYMGGGGWSLNSDSYMFDSANSQGNPLHQFYLQDLYLTESDKKRIWKVQRGIIKDSSQDEEIPRCVTRKSHARPSSSRKPCLFHMVGNCAHSECRYNHDLSSTTCRFWIRGSCFKGTTCPFLHGYAEQEFVEEEQIVKESEPENVENVYSLDSEADFPSLSSSKFEIPKSEPVNIEHIKLSKNSGHKSH